MVFGFFVRSKIRRVGEVLDEKQQFFEKICDFQMWDKGLDEGEIERLFSNDNLTQAGNVFDSPPKYRPL